MRNLRFVLIVLVIVCGLITLGPISSAQADTGSQFTDAERDAVLARHNQERQAVGVSPLVWRNDLAADAQAWADLGTGVHSVGKRPADQGESLYQKWGDTTTPPRETIASDAAASWASEKQFYDADPNKKVDLANAVCDPEHPERNTNYCKWGHYTQMVWQSTQEIGCGIKQGGPKALGWYVVCRYRPAGNTDKQEAYPRAGPGPDWSGLNDRWRNIGGFFPRGACVTTVSRTPDVIDLFITGNDGRVYTSWWYNGQDWSGLNDRWRNIGGFFPPGACVTAVSRTPDVIDLFITGNDGRVYTSWWYKGQDWSGLNDRWRNIGGFFPRGAPVTAVSRTPDVLDLFITGNDGRVYTSWWYKGQDWSGLNDRWRNIGGIFPPGARVAAVSRTPNNLDLFITGNDGRAYTSWWSSGRDWSGLNDRWTNIGANIGGLFRGAPVTAISRPPNNPDVFITGNDGRVYTSCCPGHHVDRNIGGFFPRGAPVAAVSRTPDVIDLFITGNDGRVYTSWWYKGQDWSGINDRWRNIGGIFPPGAPVAAVSRTPNNLDLFITGNDGRVYTSWWSSR